MTNARTTIVLSCLLAACGGSEEEPTADRASSTAPVLCTSPTQVLMAFGASGTHGTECAEAISIACDGSVRVSGERPCSTVLQARPGTHQIRLAEERIPELRALAGRLRAPVAAPTPPPQGFDTSMTAPVRRPLRDHPADAEAAALYREIVAQVEISVPLARLEVTLRPAGTPLSEGTSGLMVLALHTPEERTVHLGSPLAITIRPAEGEEAWFESPPAVLVFAHLDGTPWNGASLANGEELIAGVRVTPPSAGSVSLVAELRTSASFAASAPPNERSFLSLPQAFEVAE